MNTTKDETMKTNATKRISYRTKDAAAAALGITVEQLDLIGRAAYGVYAEIAYDLGGVPSISRAEAIEVSLDANRAEDMLRRYKACAVRAGRPAEDYDAAIGALDGSRDYLKLVAAMKLYFTYARYETR